MDYRKRGEGTQGSRGTARAACCRRGCRRRPDGRPGASTVGAGPHLAVHQLPREQADEPVDGDVSGVSSSSVRRRGNDISRGPQRAIWPPAVSSRPEYEPRCRICCSDIKGGTDAALRIPLPQQSQQFGAAGRQQRSVHSVDAFRGLLRLHGMNAVARCVAALLILEVAQHRHHRCFDDRPDAGFGQSGQARRCRRFASVGPRQCRRRHPARSSGTTDRHAPGRSTTRCPAGTAGPSPGSTHRVRAPRRRCSPNPAVGDRNDARTASSQPWSTESISANARSKRRSAPTPPASRSALASVNSRRTDSCFRRGRDRLQLRHSRGQRGVERSTGSRGAAAAVDRASTLPQPG